MAKIVFISPYDQYTLGVRYLTACLKQAGHQSRVIILKSVHHNRDPKNLEVDSGYQGSNASCSDKEYDYVRDLISDFEADFIGLSLASQSYGLCAWLSDRFRRDFPGVPILWGGADPTLHPELGIKHADFLATGEAEDSLVDLLEQLSDGKDGHNVEGFWVRNGEEIIRNPMRPLIQDLDRLPFPDFSLGDEFLVEDGKMEPVTKLWYIIMTQRGCPYRCTFCINSTLPGLSPGEKYTRRRSVQNVIEELVSIKRRFGAQFDFVQFFDDIFTVSKRWLKDFAPLYRDQVGLPFWCYTYPGQCDDGIAELLNVMGVSYVQFGVQSGSERTLKEVYRRADPAGVIETATVLSRHNIPARFDLIAANPLETTEDHLQTLDVLLECPHPFRINPTNPLCFYFNSPITRMAKEKGIKLRELDGVNGYLAEDDCDYEFWKVIFDLAQYPTLDRDHIRKLARDEYFKEHPELLHEFQSALQKSHWAEPGAFVSSKDLVNSLKVEITALQNRIRQLEDRLGRVEGRKINKIYEKIRPLFPTTHLGVESEPVSHP